MTSKALAGELTVVSYDGHRGAERPRAVVQGGVRLAVRVVEDAWIESGPEAGDAVTRRFRVRCDGGRRFELVYSKEHGWSGRLIEGAPR